MYADTFLLAASQCLLLLYKRHTLVGRYSVFSQTLIRILLQIFLFRTTMSFDSSTDNSDFDFEFSSSGSGCLVETFNMFSVYHPQTCQPTVILQFINIGCFPCSDNFMISNQTDTVQAHQHRLIKWSLPPPVKATVTPLPGWKPMPYGLEKFWQSAFAWFFHPYLNTHGHLWTLEPTELCSLSCSTWHTTSYLAKIRFICQCKRGWTSKKGRVMFWFRLRHEGDQVFGEVKFKLFGQQCNVCNDPESSYGSPFLPPLWYPEEMENAIRFLATQVCITLYDGSPENFTPINRFRFSQSKSSSVIHHDTLRCQVCQDGLVCSSQFFSV